METNTQEELKAHLMSTNEEFRSLAEKHAQFHKRLEELEANPHLTMEDEAEEQRLKKQKLHVKDLMNQILVRYRTQQVA
ncbi:MAG TPA: YdcH family protein [Bryobacteraceae bacterium]|nr:YdcH family protein [Bryobacteraceae bacterium]